MTDAAGSPFFSIITVCWNAAEVLEFTARSLRSQVCKDYEWIVVDGASSDATCDIARRYLDATRDTLVSEPDDGVYFAMNKGLRLARGEVVQFLNAGDAFASAETLASVKRAFQPGIDVVYGDTILVREDKSQIIRKSDIRLDSAQRRVPVSHQSLFIKTELHLTKPYDEKFRIAADYAMMSKLIVGDVNFQKLDEPLSICSLDGASISVKGRKSLAKECYLIRREIFGLSKWAAAKSFVFERARTEVVRLLAALPKPAARWLPSAIRQRIY